MRNKQAERAYQPSMTDPGSAEAKDDIAELISSPLTCTNQRWNFCLEVKQPTRAITLPDDMRTNRDVKQALEHIVVKSFRNPRPFVLALLCDSLINASQ